MATHLEPNDYVRHPRVGGVRGQVLWTDGPVAYVCWETGYEPYNPHDIEELERITVLDLLIDERALKFEFVASRNWCRCGLKLQPAAKGKLVCSRCHTYYYPPGTIRPRGRRG